jgi:hypothetical protein
MRSELDVMISERKSIPWPASNGSEVADASMRNL